MPVNTSRSDYDDMLMVWARLRDAFKGRDAIIKAGHKYVPDLKGQDIAGNLSYRQRGNYYNATSRTVFGLIGLIFQKAPVFEMPTVQLEELLTDVTLADVTMEMFALEASHDTLLVGRYGILVDMAEDTVGTINTRPYLVPYCAESIVNWRTTRLAGDEVLTLVVLAECVEQPNEKDPFVNDKIEQYRVLQLIDDVYSQQIWRKKPNSDDWITFGPLIVPMRRGKTLNFLPFVFIGPGHVTPHIGQPPMLDLVDVNLAHWRNSCDYEHGLHLVALPTPWVSGLKGDATGAVKLGPANVLQLDQNGHAGMLEFSGAGLKAISEAMDEKKKQMATLGARMLEAQQRLNETATAVLVRHSSDYASLRTVAQALEQAFTMALQIMVWWLQTETDPQDVEARCELNKEFVTVKVDPQTVATALTALQAGDMSFKTFYNILVTGGWAREGVDDEQERKDIEAEGGVPVSAADLAAASAANVNAGA